MGALTIAVVGAGPAGLYLADEMLRQDGRDVRVDIYDRLPTPFGLLRYGVAPDHLKMKALASPLQRTLDDERVRFLGNVEVGRDVTIEELRANYSAVVYTYGAASDRVLGVAGEELAGSTSSADFVRWYSGHPDAAVQSALVASDTAVVVGAGNVAIDVTRMLVKSPEELASTDVPDDVLEVLRKSQVRDVHILVRRGPAQVKFTSKELRELGTLEGVDVVVDPAQLSLTEQEQDALASDRAAGRSVALLNDWAARERTDAERRIHFHFWTSPTAFTGHDSVEAIQLTQGRTPVEREPLAAQLVVKCVGYRGTSIADVPFDDAAGTIPHRDGRVLRDGEVSPGEYAAGWISRGPVGVLGTNRANATEVVVEMLNDDLRDVELWDAPGELAARGVDLVVGAGWAAIDRAECALGQTRGADRAKIASWDRLLEAARG